MALASCCSCVVAGKASKLRESNALSGLASGLQQALGLFESAIADGCADAVVQAGSDRWRN